MTNEVVPGRRATLAAVAARAGVSTGTASSVLAGRAGVSERARLAVLTAAEDLGYQPFRRKTVADVELAGVGILGWPQQLLLGSQYYGPLVAGIQQAATEIGASVIYENVDPGTGDAGALPLCIARRQVQAVVIVQATSFGDLISRALDAGVACALVDHTQRGLPVDSVRHDDGHGGYLATTHLIEHGHRRPVPAIIAGPANNTATEDRLRGYLAALRDHGLSPRDDFIRRSVLEGTTGAAAMSALLDLREPPTAVFCANDPSALGAVHAIRQRGLSVPEDISVIGFNDERPMTEFSHPPLTTVAVDTQAMGAMAVTHLRQRVKDPAATGRETRIGVRLVSRQSVAAPRTAG